MCFQSPYARALIQRLLKNKFNGFKAFLKNSLCPSACLFYSSFFITSKVYPFSEKHILYDWSLNPVLVNILPYQNKPNSQTSILHTLKNTLFSRSPYARAVKLVGWIKF